MAFPEDFTSIKNPANVGIETVTPIILIQESPLAAGASTPAQRIVSTQEYNVYMTGFFTNSDIALEWSTSGLPTTFVRFKKVFDNGFMVFTAPGVELIPRISSGIFVKAFNIDLVNASGDITVALR